MLGASGGQPANFAGRLQNDRISESAAHPLVVLVVAHCRRQKTAVLD